MPRDIDPAVRELAGVELYDMDQLGDGETAKKNSRAFKEAMEILEDYEDELERWFAFRRHVERVKQISAVTVQDACKRMEKLTAAEAMDHAVEKLLFGLRDTLPEELWERCFTALEQSSQRDTLKTGKGR